MIRPSRSVQTIAMVASILLLPAAVTNAQEQPADPAAPQPQQQQESPFDLQALTPNLAIALSTPDYPVTPGDTYTLIYATIEGTVETNLVVDGDYTINLGIFGAINAAGLTYVQARSAIERRVAAAFPRSAPSVTLTAVGSFRVLVRGAVRQAERVGVWGLTRLSQLLTGRLEPYSSQRRVTIASADGSETTYDLLRAQLFGEVGQDPRLEPGDTVTVVRAQRTVRLEGEVYRPGVYDLLAEENIASLVSDYGRGTLPSADRSRVEVRAQYGEGVQWISLDDAGTTVTLEDGDTVVVPDISRRALSVTVEGGVGETGAESFGIVEVPYTEGMTAYEALIAVRDDLSPYADLTDIIVLRFRGESEQSEPTRFDFATLLENYTPTADVVLQPFDRIIVEAVQPQVLVSGAVNNAGLQPLAPNQTADYYIRQAGGFDPERNARDRFTVYDESGAEKNPAATIEAGDSIRAHNNSFLYSFNRFFPIIASTLSFATAVISLINSFSGP